MCINARCSIIEHDPKSMGQLLQPSCWKGFKNVKEAEDKESEENRKEVWRLRLNPCG